MKDLKDTLILPKTNFPMKANLSQNEPSRYLEWQKYAYKQMSSLDSKKDFSSLNFTLHDGPPYANGHLHIGHALNKVLKDFIVKYNYFKGKRVFYTPGWDCHGLPIEQQVLQNIQDLQNLQKAELKKSQKEDVALKNQDLKNNNEHTTNQSSPQHNELQKEKNIDDVLRVREACKIHAQKFLEIQKNEFLSLGVVGDFDNPYKTMDFKFEADIFRALVKVAKNGLLAQRSKPIFWSWAARSALAEAEVEYKMKNSDSVFVKFYLDESSINALGLDCIPGLESKPFIIIWTTTPWTLPSNVALNLNPSEIYILTNRGEIVAKKLYDSLISRNIISGEILKEFEACIFERQRAKNPLNDNFSTIILSDFVSMDDGTGIVHSAPGHGEDDYFSCLKYDLPVIMAVDDGGCFDEKIITQKLFRSEVAQELLGMHIFKAQKRILEILGDNLISHEVISHSYPHCWRTNKPVIFRATKQWFILMDKPFFEGMTLRQIALNEISKSRFYPLSGENRIRSMIEKRPDWCISRQRDWGVPIAFFIDKESLEPLINDEVCSFVADIFEKEGASAWWSKSVEELLAPSFKQDASRYFKNMHILDVWFDSGSTWSILLNPMEECSSQSTDSAEEDSKLSQKSPYNAGFYPCDMYLEGNDQHRGWFQSSLLLSCAINYHAPYKSVLTHGFVGDERGEKMSKSKGNVISPLDLIKEHGSEIVRLWVALSDYQSDIKISKNIIKQVSDNYLKIRNTIRFLLANTEGLVNIDLDNLGEIDKWILNVAKGVFLDVDKLFSEYEFVKGFSVLNNFISTELSGIYLDISKDSLYCDHPASKTRISIQSSMALIANNLLHTLAPFLTYTVDEGLDYANECIKNGAKNVFSLNKIEIPNFKIDEKKFSFLINLRHVFNENLDKLKKEKIIKSSLEIDLISHSQIDKSLIVDFLMVSNVFNSLHEASILESKNYKNENCSTDGSRDLNLDSSQSEEKSTDVRALFSFEIEGVVFSAFRSNLLKCPRCWRFLCKSEDEVCPRCQEILS